MAVDAARAKSLFLAASDLADAVERAAYLDRECGGDAELRGRVESLLRANDAAPLPPPVPERQPQTEDYGDPTARVGAILAGKYKLIEEIGEGGMGSVYMAQQTEPVKRAVAVKVIKAGMDSKAVLTRFEAERQALAMMDHPNIAKVLDAGTTDGGRPFFVMELVKGLPITKYCDERKLTPRQRLELFVPVCQAIQHAHQKGVIHRDIKPSNVLIALYDDRPVPKVIDFGVAKAAGQTLTEKTLMTGFGAVVGTPEYMSPEQANLNNVDIDTRSDVYALGVLLYELLTGSTPVDRKSLGKAAFLEILRIVREVEAPRPSAKLSTIDTLPSVATNRGTEPAKLSKLMKGELDWLVLKALEKDRTRRYETANGFAADINRYLRGEAVLAHPPSAAYQLRKFVRRNRGAVIAVSAVFLALVGGLVMLYGGVTAARYGLQRARAAEGTARADQDEAVKQREIADRERKIAVEHRTQAEKARDRTRDVLDAMTSSATGDSLSTQKEISADQRKFLTEVLTYYQEFAGEKADDERTRTRTARAADRVGRIEYRLGHKEQATAAFQMARDGYRTLAADFPAVPAYRQRLGFSHNNLGMLLDELVKRAEAEKQYRQALAIQEKLAADFPNVPAYRQELAGSHNNLGLLLNDMRQRPEAEAHQRKALAIQEKLVADFPTVPDYRSELARSHNNLGSLLRGLEKRAEAEKQYRQALATREKLAADFPTVPDYQRDLAGSHNNLGLLLQDLGKLAEAEEQYRQALAILEKLASDFPSVSKYRQELAGSHNNVGIRLAGRGKRAEAEEQYLKALAIREKLAADFPTMPAYRQDLAGSHSSLGNLFKALGKPAEAEGQYRQALTIQEKLAADFPTVPEYRQGLAASHNSLGDLLGGLGKRAEAEEQYRKALTNQEKLAVEFPTVTAHQIGLGGKYCNYGVLVRDGGQVSESLGWFDKAIATLAPVHRADQRNVTAKQFLRNSHAGRAVTCDALTKHAEAVKDWDRAIELSPPAEQLQLRASRATSRVQAGLVAEAVAEVDELTKSSNWSAGQRYNFACVYAVASGNPGAPGADKKQEYADRAMELLHQAVKAGYKDAAHMKKDTDLDPLRAREDFKKLIAELEKKK